MAADPLGSTAIFNPMATKKYLWRLAVCCLVLCAACNFSAGIKHDMKSGLTVTNTGLSFDNYKLLCNGAAVADDEWRQGETMKVLLSGIKGFTSDRGRVFPTISIRILDGAGAVKVKLDNLEDETFSEGISPEKAEALYGQYTLGQELEIGKEYKLEVHIGDKKGKGEITASRKFKIAPLQQNDLAIHASGLSYKSVYFVGRNGRNANEALLGGRVGVMVNGLSGLKEVDGKVFPGAEIIVYDKSGEEKFHSEDVFKDPKGSNPAEAAERISVYITLTKAELNGNESKWVFRVWDKKSDAYLEADILLKLIQK